METIFIREVNHFKTICDLKYKHNRLILTHKKLTIRLSCYCTSLVYMSNKWQEETFDLPISDSLVQTTMASLHITYTRRHFCLSLARCTRNQLLMNFRYTKRTLDACWDYRRQLFPLLENNIFAKK